ncbi:MAG: hypothetical protein KDC07_04470 [Chitinophagaceae bacterium]|nr:hypothetical protein [Chitinophagaceae bacterium]MCB9044982.1 hypothetical protein [Chitinophagales bacterium]
MFKSSVFIISILLLAACGSRQAGNTVYNIQAGDILFQDLDCGAPCDAIEKVTEGVNGHDFSHCGIVAEVDGQLKVVEAYGKVQAVSIDSFLARSKDGEGHPKVLIGRLKGDKKLALKSAELSEKYIGKAYDNAFTMGDDSYYCSELVYECFKEANGDSIVFPLNEMTFTDPETGELMPFWINYYKELGIAVPEGEPGINPGAISRNERLEIREVTKN